MMVLLRFSALVVCNTSPSMLASMVYIFILMPYQPQPLWLHHRRREVVGEAVRHCVSSVVAKTGHLVNVPCVALLRSIVGPWPVRSISCPSS